MVGVHFVQQTKASKLISKKKVNFSVPLQVLQFLSISHRQLLHESSNAASSWYSSKEGKERRQPRHYICLRWGLSTSRLHI